MEHPTLLTWALSGRFAGMRIGMRRSVQFRAVGESGWRKALPLVRMGGENVYRRRENLDYTVPGWICRQHPESAAGDGI